METKKTKQHVWKEGQRTAYFQAMVEPIFNLQLNLNQLSLTKQNTANYLVLSRVKS